MRWWVIVLCGGCVLLPEEDFRARYAREMCGRAQNCLWDVPADTEECREYYLDGLDDAQVGCLVPTYEEDIGKDCLSEIRRLPCEASGYANADEPAPACREVYSCATPTDDTDLTIPASD